MTSEENRFESDSSAMEARPLGEGTHDHSIVIDNRLYQRLLG